ncbi:MAG: polysaccharide deacetylase family protein [Oscillospiraceae bacterium]|nr:polysaccharide deacetylase family protein [Oscillospiraceae bacterium]
MKKALPRALCLVLALLLLASCAQETVPAPPRAPLPSPSPEKTPEPSPPPPSPDSESGVTPPPDVPEPPYSATVEYGEPELIKDNDGPLFTYIRFPQAGGGFDMPIAVWANWVYQSAREEFEDVLAADENAEGEINVHFNSYLTDDRYVGIVETGSFAHSHAPRPRDIVRTFNIDLSREIFLYPSDILDLGPDGGARALLRELLSEAYPGSSVFLGDIDERWFSQTAIGHDGIIVVLERYAFLPGAFGTPMVTLPYDRLGSALILGQERPPEPPPPSPPKPSSPPVPAQSGTIDPDRPMVALTFDDGPSRHTPHILDLLEQYGGRATFFAVGNLVGGGRDTVARAIELGCEVAGHSWDHKDLTKLDETALRTQMLDTAAAIEAVTGVSLPFFRPPYGAVNDRLKNVARELGLAIVNWTVDPLDWKNRDAGMVYDAIMRDVRDRTIILSHDLFGTTAQAMERVIPELLSQGYQLVTVSELLRHTHDGAALEAGRVYSR